MLELLFQCQSGLFGMVSRSACYIWKCLNFCSSSRVACLGWYRDLLVILEMVTRLPLS
ncbi:hypothetical protein XENTR_v10005895 [Xenopus tropicalis]|nr:hypothetical protein XENTR_v10005895 [Xenopus tropicalis]KAE8624278.1 hypothetical protein XENTR_v10005895 [Xenopus tropicalis]